MTVLMGLQARLRLARLYLCTDARTERGDLAEFCEAAFAGGVDILQIRQKDMEADEELEALQVARRAAERHQALVCVNDSPSLAERFSADVLHLGPDRRVLPPGAPAPAPVGHDRSLHPRSRRRPTEALADDDADYFCVGPVYATSTKPDYEPVGLDLVRYAARVAPPHDLAAKPWFAIGGIDEGNLDDVLAAGARRVCVVRVITLADDPEAAARSLSTRLREAWRADPAMEAVHPGRCRLHRPGSVTSSRSGVNRTVTKVAGILTAVAVVVLLVYALGSGVPTPTAGPTAAVPTASTATTTSTATIASTASSTGRSADRTPPTGRATATARTTAPRPSSLPSPSDGLAWVRLADLPVQARQTVALIDAGGPFPYAKDGATFNNFEGVLPKRARGYYREYTVRTPGERDRGARRIVTGDRDRELFYTADHYDTFARVQR